MYSRWISFHILFLASYFILYPPSSKTLSYRSDQGENDSGSDPIKGEVLRSTADRARAPSRAHPALNKGAFSKVNCLWVDPAHFPTPAHLARRWKSLEKQSCSLWPQGTYERLPSCAHQHLFTSISQDA